MNVANRRQDLLNKIWDGLNVELISALDIQYLIQQWENDNNEASSIVENQQEKIDLLTRQVEKLTSKLVKYELIRDIIRDKGNKRIYADDEHLKKQGIDLGETSKGCDYLRSRINKSEDITDQNKCLVCSSCYKDIEEDSKKTWRGKWTEEKPKIKLQKKPIKDRNKTMRKGITNSEALLNAKPSDKKKDEVICLKCGNVYLTRWFYSHYASHIKT